MIIRTWMKNNVHYLYATSEYFYYKFISFLHFHNEIYFILIIFVYNFILTLYLLYIYFTSNKFVNSASHIKNIVISCS